MTMFIEFDPTLYSQKTNIINLYNSGIGSMDSNFSACQKTPWFLYKTNLIEREEFQHNPNCHLNKELIKDLDYIGHLAGISIQYLKNDLELEIEFSIQVEQENQIFKV